MLIKCLHFLLCLHKYMFLFYIVFCPNALMLKVNMKLGGILFSTLLMEYIYYEDNIPSVSIAATSNIQPAIISLIACIHFHHLYPGGALSTHSHSLYNESKLSLVSQRNSNSLETVNCVLHIF